ncbi:hypothetical protein WN48_03142 [Eufriesea mexicana]|uniref:Uncharacterized protein n=1 Tax=Eufriesea mexicana TaxID=516756 RepID=A0A310SMX0_9HYME|nr:hypothetical protein WN48_03142 [Eufriesea mexicana]
MDKSVHELPGHTKILRLPTDTVHSPSCIVHEVNPFQSRSGESCPFVSSSRSAHDFREKRFDEKVSLLYRQAAKIGKDVASFHVVSVASIISKPSKVEASVDDLLSPIFEEDATLPDIAASVFGSVLASATVFESGAVDSDGLSAAKIQRNVQQNRVLWLREARQKATGRLKDNTSWPISKLDQSWLDSFRERKAKWRLYDGIKRENIDAVINEQQEGIDEMRLKYDGYSAKLRSIKLLARQDLAVEMRAAKRSWRGGISDGGAGSKQK